MVVKTKKLLAGMLCTALLLLSGCGAASEDAKEEADLQKITVGEVAHSIFYAPAMSP